MRQGYVGGLLLLLLLFAAAPALAHAELVSAEPAPGETVTRPLKQIELHFDDEIMDQSQVALVASDFQLATNWTQSVDGSTLTVVLETGLPPGTYTVIWSAVTPDSHTTSGSYQFAVAGASILGWMWGAAGLVGASSLALLALVIVRRRRAAV
jgi:methionine-rich copper-binding protein CopC